MRWQVSAEDLLSSFGNASVVLFGRTSEASSTLGHSIGLAVLGCLLLGAIVVLFLLYACGCLQFKRRRTNNLQVCHLFKMVYVYVLTMNKF